MTNNRTLLKYRTRFLSVRLIYLTGSYVCLCVKPVGAGVFAQNPHSLPSTLCVSWFSTHIFHSILFQARLPLKNSPRENLLSFENEPLTPELQV